MGDETGMEAPSLCTKMYACVAPQDAVSSPMRSTAAIGHHPNIWPGLCTILDTDFRE